MNVLRGKVAKVVEIRAQSLSAEIYATLEAYRVGRGAEEGPVNRRSAPGDPPARQFGHLQESVKYLIDRARLIAVVGPLEGASTVDNPKTVEYAAALEFGTRKMAARPFVVPSLTRWKAKWRR